MLMKEALLQGATAKNIVKGFAVTGICPFKPSVFSDTDFISPDRNRENEEAAAVEGRYNEEEQRRIVVADVQLGVVAHEAISTSDFIESVPSTSGTSQATNVRRQKNQHRRRRSHQPKIKNDREKFACFAVNQ